jgi:G3E family GTPase
VHASTHCRRCLYVLQLRAADVVVINKCDLASLSALSSLEDLLQDKAPGVRTLRARFGQVSGARTCVCVLGGEEM